MFILIDKPKGITSHDVVDELRRISNEKKIGHAGTLDPNATGLLILAIGRNSTKKLGKFLHLDKTYTAEIVLGQERDTDDVEGKVLVNYIPKSKIKKQVIKSVLKLFIGEQLQVPPAYSAIKIRGRKAYQLARNNKVVELSSRKIVIHSIELLKYNYPKLTVKIKVSSGTYIRALARDIGKKLGCGAYLNNLKRIRIGNFEISNAIKLSELSPKNWENYAFDI